MSGVTEMESSSEPNPHGARPKPPAGAIVASRRRLTGAALCVFAGALTIVYLFPRIALARGLAEIAFAAGAIAAAICALTWRRAARVRIGRLGLRFRAVRRAGAIAAAASIAIPALWTVALWRSPIGGLRTVASDASAPVPATFTVAIAQLADDPNDRARQSLIRDLKRFTRGLPLTLKPVNGTIRLGPPPAAPGWLSHEQAYDQEIAAGANLILWGRVETASDSERIELFETSVEDAAAFGGVRDPLDFALPRLRPAELAPIVALMLATHLADSPLRARPGVTDALDASIARVRALSDANFEDGRWSAGDRASVDFVLAAAIGYGRDPVTVEMRARLATLYALSAIANWTPDKYPLERAMALRLYANQLGLLGAITRDPKIYATATQAIRDAIALYPAERHPDDRAHAQLGLGRALMATAELDGGKELPQALEADRAALALCDRRRKPGFWAEVEWEIANMQMRIGETRGDPDQLRDAVGSFNQVLAVRTREATPHLWAITQTALGQALIDLANRDPSGGYFGEAAAAEQSALKVLTPQNSPYYWSLAEGLRGTALSSLAEERGDIAGLNDAVAALRSGLTGALRKRDPFAWVRIQAALASALESLGDIESLPDPSASGNWRRRDRMAEEHLEEAVAAARAGIEQAAQIHFSVQWAFMQSTLAEALTEIGNREIANHRGALAAEHLRAAVAAARAALTVQTPTKDPDNWADSEAALGGALTLLGQLERDPRELQDAVAAYQTAVGVQTRQRDPQDWLADQNGLSTALERLGLIESGPSALTHLRQAAAIQRALLKNLSPEGDAMNWMVSQSNLAHIEAEMGEREPGGDDLRQAAADYREELRYLSPVSAPDAWRDANDRLNAVIAMMRERGVNG